MSLEDSSACSVDVIFEDSGADCCHRRQVVGLVEFFNLGRHCAPHNEPHDDFPTFPAAAPRIFRSRNIGEAFRILLEELHELQVPFRVVETRTLSMDLMRKTAGGDNRDLEILRIAQDRFPQGFAEFVTSACCWNGSQQHADLKRNDRARPLRLVRPQDRQRREAAMIQALALEKRQVEFIGHQPRCDVRGELRVTFNRRKPAGPPPSSATG